MGGNMPRRETMSKLLIEGGVPVWFVLLFGLGALFAAIRYALQPQPRRLGLCRGLSAATLFGTLSATASNLGATFATLSGTRHGAEMSLLSKDGPLLLMTGLGESMSTPILGFALLALVGLFYAVGSARQETV
jgi:hypothetical protein